ncbi:MAG TPA: hypothetical protein DCZ76_08000 [Treponema sp.]|nr:hypothetical protein [Treponema sp.]
MPSIFRDSNAAAVIKGNTNLSILIFSRESGKKPRAACTWEAKATIQFAVVFNDIIVFCFAKRVWIGRFVASATGEA